MAIKVLIIRLCRCLQQNHFLGGNQALIQFFIFINLDIEIMKQKTKSKTDATLCLLVLTADDLL